MDDNFLIDDIEHFLPDPEFLKVFEEFEQWLKTHTEILALVLPGGGSLGRRQFGFVYFLYKIGFLKYFNMICGTSVGGLNTLLIAKMFNQLEKAKAFWDSIKSNKDIYDGILKFDTVLDKGRMIWQITQENKGRYILNKKGLKKILLDIFGNDTLKELKKRVIVTTTDLSIADMVVIDSIFKPNFSVFKLALLTSAIPIIFEGEEFENEGLTDLGIDGGVGRNNPIDLAIKAGATKIMLVGTSPNKLPRINVKNDIFGQAARLESSIMHIFEERCWDEVEKYNEFHKLAPDKYHSIEVLDWYPDEKDMNKENEINALDFTATETLLKGFNSARQFATPNVLRKWLIA